ncbi:hypothetical protein EMIHUDRAFT_216710 [Emiliania huxleyi CCMP1516]|uniref:YHYH domain-containing protein n=2 Tax=Emiliania huxleyi TaxID=2903 RepID=A0A0D3IDH4_EMIH1|nr:hypothetical protein EMIHUDRAFT_216710 [Emiliania huxleyi CCMP1516]EOD09309.1 hypothetical protein EMIHUDRAFT_216710 [Emiliania huxleyi CCMP1516]|eukprot:XP_005761738.1 hypothetical protein EMIHUDRAFT_216710 [Emiliania huxleyi CCMP1516]
MFLHSALLGTSCDPCGASASYTETIDASGTHHKRTIVSNGCPNHYNLCTGKSDAAGCGAIGVEGTATEALEIAYQIDIPAYPVLATENDAWPECEKETIAMALNGVPIYSGAVGSGDCDILDLDDANAEWTSFDFCGGHARCLAFECNGDYHYHFPPSCLETQIGNLTDGHSPQIGWSLDGFPIYGRLGPGGVTMEHTAQGCTGTYCLDDCSGFEMEIPGLDEFTYRYYFNGPLSDLVSLPTDPKPSASDYPFAMKCYRGCTYADLSAGAAKCSGGSSGYTNAYTATALAGVTDIFYSEPSMAAAGCIGGIIGGCFVPVLLLGLWASGAFGSKCPSPVLKPQKGAIPSS